jgi:hypothetical protein
MEKSNDIQSRRKMLSDGRRIYQKLEMNLAALQPNACQNNQEIENEMGAVTQRLFLVD